MPKLWLTSLVIPIFKNKPRYCLLNYRPVSLTSVCCKSLERILVAQLTNYLEMNSLITSDLFDFQKGRSTEDQLVLTCSEVAALFDAELTVDVALLDFSKAFDLVLHSILLGKLRDL